MNCLNSIIFEGNLVCDAEEYGDDVRCKVVSFRSKQKVPGHEMVVATTAIIEASGGCADRLLAYGKAGLRIRVVGHLENDGDNQKHKIVAEHIEFKPIRKTEEGATDEREKEVEA